MRIALILALLLAALVPGGESASVPARLPAHYAGWAVEAYPDASTAEMEATVRRLVAHGANIVWIGHNNPGIVDAQKVEPGLSYAVYEAYIEPADERHDDAVAIVEAQHRMLAACRTAGVPAVLPVGYQIQMGVRWNEAHPDALRRDAEGEPLDIYGGGVSASFYAPAYRRDIERYYRWIEAEFARPYADVLLMLNLADEPLGGDYSAHAEAEFRRRHGFRFDEVGADRARQRLLGEFQSRYVVEYAAYSAGQWQALHPGLPVTMSFDGAQARQTFTMPDVEALFRDTPDNIVVTFDAYPRDGLPNVALDDADLVGLFLLARSIGLYSARYDRPVWLWAAANSWGLSQASPDPGSVSDAVANGIYLSLLVRQAGGSLQGIAYWNYNVKEQGLYNDTHDVVYDVETMFARVSAALPLLRRLMATGDAAVEVLVLAPPARAYEAIGAQRAAVLLEVHLYHRLQVLAQSGVNVAVVGRLEEWQVGRLEGWKAARRRAAGREDGEGEGGLEGVRTIVVLAPSVESIDRRDVESLRVFLERGGKVLAAAEVAQALDGGRGGNDVMMGGGLVERRGSLYAAQQGVGVLFEASRRAALNDFWREALGIENIQPGYRVETGGYAFHYQIGAAPALVDVDLAHSACGYRYDANAMPVERLCGAHLEVPLNRREYILLKHDPRAWPWPVEAPLTAPGAACLLWPPGRESIPSR
ncbi:MAG TPA: hypothetical protein VLC95_01160 [Anaerolineae bacterium]|nr:hypothetical protein [Anaerolineae bacterium]